MRWNVLFVSATLLVAASLPSAAQISIDMNKVTCGRWLGYSPEERDFVRFWMSGSLGPAVDLTTVQIACGRLRASSPPSEFPTESRVPPKRGLSYAI